MKLLYMICSLSFQKKQKVWCSYKSGPHKNGKLGGRKFQGRTYLSPNLRAGNCKTCLARSIFDLSLL